MYFRSIFASSVARESNIRDIRSRCDPMSHKCSKTKTTMMTRDNRNGDDLEERDRAGEVVPPPPAHRCVLIYSS